MGSCQLRVDTHSAPCLVRYSPVFYFLSHGLKYPMLFVIVNKEDDDAGASVCCSDHLAFLLRVNSFLLVCPVLFP